MNLSAPFIRRPVATTLITVAIALAGAAAFTMLPVARLPEVDFPTIAVAAALPGASPEIMASSVATPLERQFGRIAGVTQMTSTSYLGTTAIVLQFDLNRDIDAAARDVESAINAARGYLPTNLPSNPTYRKVNPADAPILILSLTSNIYDEGKLYDEASTIMQQKLSQISGVGQIIVGGSSLPAVRVEVNPTQLNAYGLSLENLRGVLSLENANRPKGQISNDVTTGDITTNDQLLQAESYRPLIIGYQNGAAVRLSDVAQVNDSVEDLRALGLMNGKPAVLLIIFRQPGANIIDVVDRVQASLPQLHASLPAGIDVTSVLDQTVTIRASVREVEITLLISIFLVVLVVFVFLRSFRSTVIPSVAVPVSLIGTFGVMYLAGFSLDNLSLMALTISTGFVVDDAIVVIENITRYIEQGMRPMQAALKGAQEIGFTVLSISISLVAVFIPILLMGGIVGRLFREFAVTLSVAILVSLGISLTTTPMMCSRLLKHISEQEHGRMYRASERFFQTILKIYERTLAIALEFAPITLAILLITIALNFYLLEIVPKGFVPEEDTGRIAGTIIGEQDTSFQAMRERITRFVNIIHADPAVSAVMGFSGGGAGTTINTGRVFMSLKPLEERKVSATQVIDRLRPKLAEVPGATLYLQAVQDISVGGRLGAGEYQYTIQSDNLQDLNRWGPVLLAKMRQLPQLTDVSTDQQNNGLEAMIDYDRGTAARMGITPELIDSTLYDAFGQRQVSTMYTQLNQYHVVMEVAPEFWQNPAELGDIYVSASSGRQSPLSAFTKYEASAAPLAVNHQGQFPSVTISFNLALGVALGDAAQAISEMERGIGMPGSIQRMFSGTAEAFESSLSTEPMLIVTALMAVYIVLGILYESYVHPITILSTLPSAGVGAVLALLITRTELSVIALIGIILLIGIVKKNAILMIDFALAAERNEGKNPRDAIYEACLLRFRPIIMTTMAAMLGALPLAIGFRAGAELRRPLGIAIIGGLIVSQILTLYTTPVVYLYLDRLRLQVGRRREIRDAAEPSPGD
jgi:hydrophobe/amphiphile efflux-1 (HAE1) family protein